MLNYANSHTALLETRACSRNAGHLLPSFHNHEIGLVVLEVAAPAPPLARFQGLVGINWGVWIGVFRVDDVPISGGCTLPTYQELV